MRLFFFLAALALFSPIALAEPTPTLNSGERCERDSEGNSQSCFCSVTGQMIGLGDVCQID